MFSFPNVSAKYFKLSAHHSSSRPSRWMRSMSSGVADTLMRIALTWLLPTLRVSPASSSLLWIAAERSFTPSGYSMSFRLRCVRVGSAFLGMIERSMWRSFRCRNRAPFPCVRLQIPYKIPFFLAYETMILRIFGDGKKPFDGVCRGASPCYWGIFSVACNAARKIPNKPTVFLRNTLQHAVCLSVCLFAVAVPAACLPI